jgi:alpha-1,3-rhamnosyl/mannosyltransferase
LNQCDDIDRLFCFTGTGFSEPDQLLEDTVINASATVKKNHFLRSQLRRVPAAYQLRTLVTNYKFKRAIKQTSNGDALYHEPNYILKPFSGCSITTIHDLSHIHYPQYHPKERVRFLERELPRTLQRADHIVTDSEFIRNEVIEILGVDAQRVTAIPLGVGGYFHPRSSEEVGSVLDSYRLNYGEYLLTVATLEPRKNLDGLLDAFLRLPEPLRKRYPLIFVGGHGWQSHRLDQRLTDLELKGEVRRLGYVADEHLPALYSGARGFVFPSFYEGFGLPPLEAMASGVPVLTADNSAMAEVVGQAGILIDAENNDDLLVGLERLLTDEKFRQCAVEDGLEQAQKFSWPGCVEKTVKLYKKAALTNGLPGGES